MLHKGMKDVPKTPHIFRRGNTLYLRKRVHVDLVSAYGGKKEVVRSLKTTDLTEARSRALAEQLTLEQEFKEKRQALKEQTITQRSLSDISDDEIAAIVMRWYKARKTEAEAADRARLINHPDDIDDAIINLSETEAELRRQLLHGEHYTQPIERLLAENNIVFEPNLKQTRQIAELLNRGSIDLVMQALEKYTNGFSKGPQDPFFLTQPAPHTQQSNDPVVTFGDLCTQYKKARIDQGLKPKSITSIEREMGLLKKFISPKTDIKHITRQQCREVFERLRSLPSNAAKSYPNTSIEKMIEKARRDNAPLLGIRTVNTYMTRLSALFKFAQEEMLLNANPATGLILKDPEDERDKRLPFKTEHLQTIFSAPIYTGCANGDNGYNKLGDERPRNSKFWIPLIALFTGMRMNEICQLQTEDIQVRDGVHVISVNRIIKTKNSRRIIPVHPELIKIGFLTHVENIKKSNKTALFPDLKMSTQGNFSHKFSRWFAKFMDHLKIHDKKLCFHSFRHTFNDAMTEARIPDKIVKELGGWSRDSMDAIYGSGVSAKLLNEHVVAIQYDGLDLSHLYPEPRKN